MRDPRTQLPTEDGQRSRARAASQEVLVGCQRPERAAGEVLALIDWDGARAVDVHATAELFLSLLD